MREPGLRIGQLARQLGTTTKTLRFYEQAGLLQAVQRSDVGYRLYDASAAKRAGLVLGLRRLGLTIEEMRELLHDDRNDHDGPNVRQRLMALMDDKLRELDVDLSVLQGRRDDLAARHEALLSIPRTHAGHCVCAALFIPCSCGTDAVRH